MGWRFRRSFSLIPGVRLNLSKSGLSTSVGSAPFTLNVGRRGFMGTASIPGTGISYRKQLSTRRKTQTSGLGLLFVLGLITVAVSRVVDSIGGTTVVIIAAGVCILTVWLIYLKRKARRAYLLTKYGNPTIVGLILQHRFWQGQTAEQLIDSLGAPHALDKKLLKTMKREVWKYNPRGVNRYALRITLDNDVVTAWDQKQ